jgi:hypothetical protein
MVVSPLSAQRRISMRALSGICWALGLASVVLGFFPTCQYRAQPPVPPSGTEPGPELYGALIWIVVGGFFGYVLLRMGFYFKWRSKGAAE